MYQIFMMDGFTVFMAVACIPKPKCGLQRVALARFVWCENQSADSHPARRVLFHVLFLQLPHRCYPMWSPVLFHVLFQQPQKNPVIAVEYPKTCRLNIASCISIKTIASKQGGHFLCQVPCSGAYCRSRILVFWVEVGTESGGPAALQQSNQVIQLTF